ncbi:heme ABC transporter ATP-binding protein [Bacillus sp. NPDC093026]|uniref:heme ABC transporter ATP-binding protein n=1 Tax=Bacillus sp. NPDC093026 TaxID=3363948 RepID=UPI0038176660
MIQVKEVRCGYGEKQVIRGISFEVKEGEFVGILGPNGSGKTTLLKMMAGILTPESGHVLLNDRSIQSYRPKALAQKIAVLPQKTNQAFSFTVEETVQFGRYPYQKGLLQSLTKEDLHVINKVIEQTDIARFKEKSIHELSGGEQQRVYLAQALAQQPQYLLLDEPTSFLDLAYQKNLLDFIKEETTSFGLTVIAVFHDVNIASLYCDRLLLLHQGKAEVFDEPDRVLTTERIQRVYETDVTKLHHPLRATPQLIIEPATVSASSNERKLADGWRTYGSNGMTYSIDHPLRILSSHKDNGGFFWKRSLGTGTWALHDTSEQSDGPDDMLFLFQADGQKEYAAESDGDHLYLYGMQHQGELTVWLLLNGFLSDGAFVQLMGQLMRIIQMETSLNIHHLCIAATQSQEDLSDAISHALLREKINHLFQTLDAIKK